MTSRLDDTDGSEQLIGIGSAHGVFPADEERQHPAGRIYVPDPESRHGWREYYIDSLPREKPGARPLGFGRRP
jgi:hypothetical protein